MARAEDPGPSTVTVLRPNGRLVAHYLLDKEGERQIRAGTESPHLEFLPRFLDWHHQANKPKQVAWDPERPSLGQLPGGHLLVLKNGERFVLDGEGVLGLLDPAGQFTPLLPHARISAGGRSLTTGEPQFAVAGLRLFSDSPEGVVCRRLPDGEILWRSNWHLGHARWDWGVFEEEGALYADTTRGLARIDPTSGRVLWVYPDAGELEKVRLGPDGLLYLTYRYAERIRHTLGKAAVGRYGWPWNPDAAWFAFKINVVPYRTGYFGLTYYDSRKGPQYLDEWPNCPGVLAVWECKDGVWSWIFELKNPGKHSQDALDRIFARHGFSGSMRKRLMEYL
ncbi:MAG: hypothetical protein AMXMBFR33_61120 [Candidatus Xenobia bacterium]